MSYLKLTDICKQFGSGEFVVNALADVSFELNNGEFVVILGSSGAGKTTLLNILGGMDKATSGEIVVDGKNITNSLLSQHTFKLRFNLLQRQRLGITNIFKQNDGDVFREEVRAMRSAHS